MGGGGADSFEVRDDEGGLEGSFLAGLGRPGDFDGGGILARDGVDDDFVAMALEEVMGGRGFLDGEVEGLLVEGGDALFVFGEDDEALLESLRAEGWHGVEGKFAREVRVERIMD